MDQETLDEFIEAGKLFWTQAECPTEEDTNILFHALVYRDHGEIEELFDRFNITTPWSENNDTGQPDV